MLQWLKCKFGYHSHTEITSFSHDPDFCIISRKCECGDTVTEKKAHVWERRKRKDKNCIYERHCTVCNRHEETKKEFHTFFTPPYDWQEDTEDDNPCKLIKKCKDCGSTIETKIVHDWTGWTYESEDSCIQVIKCKRTGCAAVRERREKHDWGEWEYESEDSCIQAIKCKRTGCAAVRERREKHDWGEWEYESEDSCIQAIKCKRTGCAAVRERREKHDWGEWECESEDSCIQAIKCKRTGCAAVRETREKHDWENGQCKRCKKKCTHDFNKYGLCTICKHKCTHEWTGTWLACFCINCGSVQQHKWDCNTGKCIRCNQVCDHYWVNSICKICGMTCRSHIWEKCECIVCGKLKHRFYEGVCKNCGKKCQHSYEIDRDFCDICLSPSPAAQARMNRTKDQVYDGPRLVEAVHHATRPDTGARAGVKRFNKTKPIKAARPVYKYADSLKLEFSDLFKILNNIISDKKYGPPYINQYSYRKKYYPEIKYKQVKEWKYVFSELKAICEKITRGSHR